MIKILLFILKILPFKLNQMLGFLLGSLFTIGGKNKNIVQQNIKLCFPNLNTKQQKKLVNKNLIHLGKFIIESSYIWGKKINKNSKIITSSQGLELINNNQKIILLIPHFGCFEVLSRVIADIRPITSLYKKTKKKYLNKIINNNRKIKNFSLVATNIKGISQLNKMLKNNKLISILPDQYPQGKGAIFVDFFGIQAKTTTLLVKLMRKNNAKIILTYAKRNKKGFDIVLENIDIDAETIEKSVQKMNFVIEKLIRKYPEQYLWNYKRFKETYQYQ